MFSHIFTRIDFICAYQLPCGDLIYQIQMYQRGEELPTGFPPIIYFLIYKRSVDDIIAMHNFTTQVPDSLSMLFVWCQQSDDICFG